MLRAKLIAETIDKGGRIYSAEMADRRRSQITSFATA